MLVTLDVQRVVKLTAHCTAFSQEEGHDAFSVTTLVIEREDGETVSIKLFTKKPLTLPLTPVAYKER